MDNQPPFKGRLSKIISIWLLLGLSACQPTRSVSEQSVSGNSVKSASLIGQTPAQVRTLLGSAHLERRDLPAELWQFRGTDCVVDVFFYTVPGQPAKVIHIISRLRNGAAVDNDICLAKLERRSS